MQETMNFYQIPREQWQGFYTNGMMPFTQEELDNIKSLNDRISVQDVEDVYVPLCHLIHLYMKEFESLTLSKGLFLHRYVKMPPLSSASLEVSPSAKVPPHGSSKICWPVCFPVEPSN